MISKINMPRANFLQTGRQNPKMVSKNKMDNPMMRTQKPLPEGTNMLTSIIPIINRNPNIAPDLVVLLAREIVISKSYNDILRFYSLG